MATDKSTLNNSTQLGTDIQSSEGNGEPGITTHIVSQPPTPTPSPPPPAAVSTRSISTSSVTTSDRSGSGSGSGSSSGSGADITTSRRASSTATATYAISTRSAPPPPPPMSTLALTTKSQQSTVSSLSTSSTSSSVSITSSSLSSLISTGVGIPVGITSQSSPSSTSNLPIIIPYIPKCKDNLPIECANGACASTTEDCFHTNNCLFNNTNYFLCSDYTCQRNPSLCDIQSSCENHLIQCWDGSCSQECPVINACPYLHRRCGDLSCVNEELSICDSILGKCYLALALEGVKCPDGSCVANEVDCPVKFNGCGVNKIQCFNGECVTDLKDCKCNGSDFRYKCYDGSCQKNCSESYAFISPLDIVQSLPSTILEPVIINIISKSTTNQINLGNLKIYANSLTSNEDYYSVKVTSLSNSEKAKTVYTGIFVTPAIGLNLIKANFSNSIDLTFNIESEYANKDKSSFCFAFKNENELNWKCLEPSKVTLTNTYIRASINHFSNWGVLLDDNSNFESSSEDQEKNPNGNKGNKTIVLAGIIVSCVAVVIVIGSVVAWFVYKRKQENHEETDMMTKDDNENDFNESKSSF